MAGAVSDTYQTILASYVHRRRVGPGGHLSESESGLIICDGLGVFTLAGPVETTNSTGVGVGGLVGSSCGIIEAGYATGMVSGTAAVGGLVGSASFDYRLRPGRSTGTNALTLMAAVGLETSRSPKGDLLDRDPPGGQPSTDATEALLADRDDRL